MDATQCLCEESVFNIVRCNWADQVEDELACQSSSGSEVSSNCAYPKSDSAHSLNLFRQKQELLPRRFLDTKPSHTSLRHHGSQAHRSKKSKAAAPEQARRKGESRQGKEAKQARKGPLLDLGALGESLLSLDGAASRADTSRNWNADKSTVPEGKAHKRAASRNLSLSGSSTSRSGSSTARSVASRADTEEWTRPLRVNPESKSKESSSSRHARSCSDTWRSGSSKRGSS